eukprot:jgi/Tetstr1/442185/TSEL_030336.t1
MGLRSALSRLVARGSAPLCSRLRPAVRLPGLELASTGVAHAGVARGFGTGESPGSRSGAPLLPGGLHGWAAEAWARQEAPTFEEGATHIVAGPTGTMPVFMPSLWEVDSSAYERLKQPLDLDSILPQSVEELDVPGAEGPEGLQCFHQTYNPGNVKRKRRHGFLSRMTSKGGRRVVKRRKARGRRKVTA